MTIYDIALICNPKNIIATTFISTFKSILRVRGITVSTFDSIRSALVYDPLLMLEVATSEDIDTNKRGFLIECSDSSELVSIMIQSLESQGIPKSTESGYVVTGTSTYIHIKLNLGYTTNIEDCKMLTVPSVPTIATKLFEAIQEPAKYIKIYDDKILTVDPDIDLGLYNEVAESKQLGCKGLVVSTSYQSKPLNLLRLEKSTPDSHTKYRWKTQYKTSEPMDNHVLIFSARLVPGTSSSVPLQILIGDTCTEYLIQSNELMTFKVDFVPKRIEPYETSLPFKLEVCKPNLDDLSLELTVKQWRYPVQDELSFSLEVATFYDIYFGISSPGSIDIGGVQVCKRGVLDILDDPIQRYTPYPTVYDPYKSVDMQLGSASGLANKLTTSTATFLSKATVKPINLFDIANLPVLSQTTQAENAIRVFTDSLGTIVSSVSSILGGGIPFINLDKLKVNFGPIESALNDPTLDFNKKKYMQQMVNSMKIIQRAQTHALGTNSTMAQQVAKLEAQVKGTIHDSIVKIGVNFQDVTKQLDKLKKSIELGAIKSSSSTTNPIEILNIAKTTSSNPLASLGSLVSTATSGIPKNTTVNVPAGIPYIPENITKAASTKTIAINPLSTILSKIEQPILKTGNEIEADIKTAQSKIGSVLGSINPILSSPMKSVPIVGTGSQVPGKDYSRYWKP